MGTRIMDHRMNGWMEWHLYLRLWIWMCDVADMAPTLHKIFCN
jgi:hypothetical protein